MADSEALMIEERGASIDQTNKSEKVKSKESKRTESKKGGNKGKYDSPSLMKKFEEFKNYRTLWWIIHLVGVVAQLINIILIISKWALTDYSNVADYRQSGDYISVSSATISGTYIYIYIYIVSCTKFDSVSMVLHILKGTDVLIGFMWTFIILWLLAVLFRTYRGYILYEREEEQKIRKKIHRGNVEWELLLQAILVFVFLGTSFSLLLPMYVIDYGECVKSKVTSHKLEVWNYLIITQGVIFGCLFLSPLAIIPCSSSLVQHEGKSVKQFSCKEWREMALKMLRWFSILFLGFALGVFAYSMYLVFHAHLGGLAITITVFVFIVIGQLTIDILLFFWKGCKSLP